MEKFKLITFVIGTRPEAIKLAPVILAFRKSDKFRIRVILTGQHQMMVRQVMDFFKISEDKNLNIMKDKQSLSYITSSTLNKLEEEFNNNKPDLVIVQGDTNTAFAGGLSAFYFKIPVGHVEAGLRTDDKYQPFPEEVNRRMISEYATLHFAPTQMAKENLLSAGIKENIYVTGNTVVDALLYADKKITGFSFPLDYKNKKIILTTIHRRENWGNRYKQILIAIKEIISRNDNIQILLPMHNNPSLRTPIQEILGGHPRVLLTESLNYIQLVSALKYCSIVLTDSGGLQEEGPTFGKPVLVLRDKTERQEGIKYGVTKLIGTKKENIIFEVEKILKNKSFYDELSNKKNPFGDGNSSKRILEISKNFFNLSSGT